MICAMGNRACAAASINSRNGISFTASPNSSARPCASFTVAKGGGTCQPIGSAITRAIQPEGASRKASPSASAAWGVASSGGIIRNTAGNRASNPSAASRASSVDPMPVNSVSARLVPKPGSPISSRSGASVGPACPSAGRWPRAAASVSPAPAAIGRANPTRITARTAARSPRPARFISCYAAPSLRSHGSSSRDAAPAASAPDPPAGARPALRAMPRTAPAPLAPALPDPAPKSCQGC